MILFSISDLYEYQFKALIKMRPRSTEFNEDKSMYLVCVSSFKIYVKIPMTGHVSCLNASVACAILVSEAAAAQNKS